MYEKLLYNRTNQVKIPESFLVVLGTYSDGKVELSLFFNAITSCLPVTKTRIPPAGRVRWILQI